MQHHGGSTLNQICVLVMLGFQQAEPDIPEPVPTAALQIGQHLPEDLRRQCPDQRLALRAKLEPQLLEHRVLVLLAELVFPIYLLTGAGAREGGHFSADEQGICS